MTTSSALRFEVVGARGRRVVATSPATRPDLRLPCAHPVHPAVPGRSRTVSACAVARPERRSTWLTVKVALVSALAVIGGTVSAVQLVGTGPDPAVEYVPGHPAWAHVTHP